MKTSDASLWLKQAQDDYRFGRSALNGRFYAQSCFVAQQAAEKAVKAVHYARGSRIVLGHSVHTLLKALNSRAGVTPELLRLGGVLDQYYVSSRYPDALPGVAPVDAFSREQAGEALKATKAILTWATTQLRDR